MAIPLGFRSFSETFIVLLAMILVFHPTQTGTSSDTNYSTFCENENLFTSQNGNTAPTTCNFIDDDIEDATTAFPDILTCEDENNLSKVCPPDLLSSSTVISSSLFNTTSSPSPDIVTDESTNFKIIHDVIIPHDGQERQKPIGPINLNDIKGNFYTIDERWFRLLLRKNCNTTRGRRSLYPKLCKYRE